MARHGWARPRLVVGACQIAASAIVYDSNVCIMPQQCVGKRWEKPAASDSHILESMVGLAFAIYAESDGFLGQTNDEVTSALTHAGQLLIACWLAVCLGDMLGRVNDGISSWRTWRPTPAQRAVGSGMAAGANSHSARSPRSPDKFQNVLPL